MNSADTENDQLNPQSSLLIPKTAAVRWDEQMRAWQECQARTGRGQHPDWESEQAARRYWDMVYHYQPERLEYLISHLQPVARKRILDIGSGPGVLAIPLAEAGARVTAMEPSASMLKVLQETAARRHLTPIDCLCGRWEDLDLRQTVSFSQSFDIVVASLSLLMVGIRDCLLKMKQVCSPNGQIFLLWTSGQNHWTEELKNLYPELYGFDYVPKPGADLLLQVVREVQSELAAEAEDRPMISGTKTAAAFNWPYGGPAGFFNLNSGSNPDAAANTENFDDKILSDMKIKDEAKDQHPAGQKFFHPDRKKTETSQSPVGESLKEISQHGSSNLSRSEVYKFPEWKNANQPQSPKNGRLPRSSHNPCPQKDSPSPPAFHAQEIDPGFILSGHGSPESAPEGRQLAPGPVNCLPDLALITTEKVEFIYRESFSSWSEVLAHFQAYFRVKQDDLRRTAILKEFLKRNLTGHDDGLLLEHPLPALLIRWQNKASS